MEEALAAFHEELEFGMNYAHAMLLDENYRAAAEVIEEQRRSLARASDTIERALARPEIERRRMRVRAALSGLAAAILIGTGALAAFGPQAESPVQDTRIDAVELASESLSRAAEISDPLALQQLFGSAQQTVLEVAHATPADPSVKQSLLNFVRTQARVLQQNRHIPDQIRERAQDVAAQVQQVVTEEPLVELIVPEDVEETPAATEEAAE